MSLQEVAQIANKFTVFGRVTPEQKHTIIRTLKTQGNTVAMTGDGVNDTLALKEANCSIAMADGSEVARNISHLVLMESNFSALPSIVKEGRQIVNNVQHSSVLYLMKTLFTIMLCITTLILRISYPFTPKQLLLLEMFVIGIPSFILTFQPNKELIRGNFIPQVLKKSIPCSLLMFISILIVLILNENTSTLTATEFTSLCTLLLTFDGFINLVWVCWPLNWLRAICVSISAILICSCLAGLGKFFGITDYTVPVMITLTALLLCEALVIVCIFYLKEWIINKRLRKKQALSTVNAEEKNISQGLEVFKNKANKYSAENLWEKLTRKWSKEETIADSDEAIVVESIQKKKAAKKEKQTRQKTANKNAENKIQEEILNNTEKAQQPVEEKVSKKKKSNKKTA